MDQIRLRDFSSYEYGDPVGFLVKLRELEAALPDLLPARVRRLRTNTLKPGREMRDAALFCLGISAWMGLPVRFAPVEVADFDFVATWLVGDTQHFCPVQLKELVSEDLNPKQSVDDLLEKLANYSDIQSLTVAILWNRSGRFDPTILKLPQDLKLGGLWVFGCSSPDQSQWAIWGDFSIDGSHQCGIVYDYPS